MVYIGLIFHVQRCTKEFRCITFNGQKFLKCIYTGLCGIKYNKINMGQSDVQSNNCYKNSIDIFHLLCTGLRKKLRKYYMLWIEMTG